jgi:YHS domain-containing protein
MKKLILFLIVGIGIAAAVWVGMNRAADFKPINADAENAAVRGFDTVAYFTEQKPVGGKKEFSHEWNGAKWFFSSEENKNLFVADPEKYAPQFGGYCAWAVSHGYTADGDPEAWKIVDGKLYLNYNQDVKKKWEAEQDKLIKDGEKNWSEFKTKKPEHKG